MCTGSVGTPPAKQVHTSVPPLTGGDPQVARRPRREPAEAVGRQRGAGRLATLAAARGRSRARGGRRPCGRPSTYAADGAEEGGSGCPRRSASGRRCRGGRGCRRRARRGADQQAGDEEVPHHPAGGGVPEEAVAGPQVVVQAELLEVLEQDAALGLHDRLGQAGRAGGVQHPQGVVEGDLLEPGSAAGRRPATTRPRACLGRPGCRAAGCARPRAGWAGRDAARRPSSRRSCSLPP